MSKIIPHKLFPIALVIYEMITYLANDMYLPSLPQMSHDLLINTQSAQLTLTMWFFGLASSSLVLGPLSDRWGRRPILFIHGSLFLLATVICALTSNLVIFLVARFFQGSVVCSIGTAGYASIHESYESFAAIKILALMGSIIILGPAFGPLVGSAILKILSWRWIFGLLFLTGLIALLALWFVMPESNPAVNRKPLQLKVIRDDYLAILSNSQFVLKLLVFCFAYLAMIAWVVLGPFLVIQQFHYTTTAFGILQALVFGSMLIAAQIIKHFSEKIGIDRLITLGLLFGFIASIFAISFTLLFPHHLLALVIPLSGFIFGTSLAFFPLNRLAIESCNEPMGARTAIFGTIMSLFGVIGSVVLSHTFNGSLVWLAGLLLVLSLSTIVCFGLAQQLKSNLESKIV